MILRIVGNIVSMGAAAVAIFCFAVMDASGATIPNTAPNVTYTASGTFSNPASSGADTLRLAGEPFSISIVANAASPPRQHGPNWAVYSPFKMTGTVNSGLLGPTPINIASGAASILEMVGPSYDVFQTAFPVKVVGISLTINALIYMPPGTITKQTIQPFAPVTLNPGNATVTYSNGTDTTTLSIASGTLVASIPTGGSVAQTAVASPAGLVLQANVTEVGTAHGDQTRSEGPMPAEPAVSVALNERAALKLYGGVRLT